MRRNRVSLAEMAGLGRWREWAKGAKREALTLYYAGRDPRTPLAAKLVAGAVVAYAFCPIDLIPDFIPVLGALDDLALLPLGVALARQMVPRQVLDECRALAEQAAERPRSRWMAPAIVAVWLLVALCLLRLVLRA